MTREEAIGKWIYPAISTMWNTKICNEILEALEQEPCEDAISRQAALDAMYELCDTGETLKENPWRDNPHIDGITDALDNLQAVTPQPKTGKWILKRTFPTKLYDEFLNEYKCSECYREIRCTESQLVNYPYCHCGAKIESEE